MHFGNDVIAADGLALCARATTAAAAENPAEQIAEIADVEAAEVEVDVLAPRPGAPRWPPAGPAAPPRRS